MLCAVWVMMEPSGVVHTVFTVTGTFIAGLNMTVQVRVTSDPTGQMGLDGLLVISTEVGAGTVKLKD